MKEVYSVEKYRLIKKANELMDRIERNARVLVEHSKNKNNKKAA